MANPSMPTPPQAQPTRVDRFLRWAKSNRVVALLVIFGIIVGAVGSFADSARKLATSIAEVIGFSRGPSAEELTSQAKVRQAAEVVGAYYSRAIGQQVLDFRSPTREEVEGVEAAVRGMIVAFHAQKQPEKVKIAELALELTKKIRRSPHVVEYWQLPELQSQRDEMASIFLALGVTMPRAESPASGAVK